ncbi:MAG: polysaccharide pyruvyl transferase CsaB [Syntrophomonadaceae bacterium]|nr:polysaccharide pyruvyl transferase CsaB [Syntrophomonadaceae bacterium]
MRVVLSGYYGFDNAGDEALLTAITSSLGKFNPDAHFVVLSGNPARTEASHGIRAVNRINPLALIRELRQANLLISGGGSLLQDITGPFSLPYYVGIVALARLLGTPVVLYAQGVGPLRRRFSKILVRLVINRVELVTLRDEDSRQALAEIGVTRPPVKVTADPVFALDPAAGDFAKAERVLGDLGLRPSDHIIGVSVRAWNHLGDYAKILARVLDQLAGCGHKILFIPLHYPEDITQSQGIIDMMDSPAMVVREELSSLETMALITRVEVLIGMRLHSLIFAACGGVPFVGISYDPKVDNFLKQFNRPSVVRDNRLDGNSLLHTVQAVLKNREREARMIKQKALAFKEKAVLTAGLAWEVAKRREGVDAG